MEGMVFPPPEVARFFATFPEIQIILGRSWIASHLMTIMGTFVYALTALKAPGVAVLFYTIADLGAIITYSIIIYRQNFLNRPFVLSVIPLSEAVKSENFHLLMLAMLWMITPAQFLKILPFYLYSILNIAIFLVQDVLDPYGSFVQALMPLITYFEKPILNIASHVDLFLFPVMFIQLLIRGSFYGLIIFFFIWCLRVETSYSSRRSIYSVLDLITKIIAQPATPPHILHYWLTIRSRIELIIPLTNFHSGFALSPPMSRASHDRKLRRRHRAFL